MMNSYFLFPALLSKCYNPGILFSKSSHCFPKQETGGFFFFPDEAETPVEEEILLSATNYDATLDKTEVKPIR